MRHPFRELRNRPHITLERGDSEEEYGHLEFCEHGRRRMYLSAGMLQGERRATCDHELAHDERGPAVPGYEEVEERVVDEISARRMIPLDLLIDALVWCGNEWEMAEHVWCDVPTVVVRLRTLSPDETRAVSTEIDRRELDIP